MRLDGSPGGFYCLRSMTSRLNARVDERIRTSTDTRNLVDDIALKTGVSDCLSSLTGFL